MWRQATTRGRKGLLQTKGRQVIGDYTLSHWHITTSYGLAKVRYRCGHLLYLLDLQLGYYYIEAGISKVSR